MEVLFVISSDNMIVPPFHVVQECCIGDEANQWKSPKIDCSPHRNPSTDIHQNWHAIVSRTLADMRTYITPPLEVGLSVTSASDFLIRCGVSFQFVFTVRATCSPHTPKYFYATNTLKHIVPVNDVLFFGTRLRNLISIRSPISSKTLCFL